MSNTFWRFQPNDTSNAGAVTYAVRALSSPSFSWSGVIVVSGRVSVHGTVNGKIVHSETAIEINVTERTFDWGADQVGRGTLSEACFGPWNGYYNTRLGAALAPDCRTDEAISPNGSGGVTVGSGTGPNAGISYVVSHSYFFIQANGLHPSLIPGGTQYYINNPGPCSTGWQSMWGYNGAGCQNEPNFTTWTRGLQAHEDRHIDIGLAAKTESDTNLPAQLEGQVATDSGNLLSKVETAYNVANSRMINKMLAIDDYDLVTVGNAWIYEPGSTFFVYRTVEYAR